MGSKIEQSVLINIREGIQTPPLLHEQFDLRDPSLPPPCQIVVSETLKFIDTMQQRPDLILELPNSMSCPSATKINAEIIKRAEKKGIADNVAIHVRMIAEDARLAAEIGAKRIHLFGNSAVNGGGRRRSVRDWLNNLTEIAEISNNYNVRHVRASLEQTTQTNIEDIKEFISGIGAINRQYPNIITSLGLPDTNGLASPEQYQRLFNSVGNLIKQIGLTVFIHGHNDSEMSLENARIIKKMGRRFGIPIILETVHPTFSGERVGLQPTFEMISQFGTQDIPHNAYDLFYGSSWLQNKNPNRKLAVRTNVAGVHTKNMECYGDEQQGIPAPGIYSIMGQGNFSHLHHTQVLHIQSNIFGPHLLKSLAIVGREYASQFGNQNQSHLLAFVELSNERPNYIYDIANKFGQPSEWISSPLPDLRKLRDLIEGHIHHVIRA